METLLEPNNRAKLAALIKNHVITGKIDLKDGEKLVTVNNNELLVTINDGAVRVGNATLQAREAKISSGVIHITDTVLLNN